MDVEMSDTRRPDQQNCLYDPEKGQPLFQGMFTVRVQGLADNTHFLSGEGLKLWIQKWKIEKEKGDEGCCSKQSKVNPQERYIVHQGKSNLMPSSIWKDVSSIQRQREAEEVIASAEIWYAHSKLYLNEILSLPRALAVRYLLHAVPAAELLILRFHASVHLGLGLYIPSHLHMHLSAGLKYMFHPHINKSVIYDV